MATETKKPIDLAARVANRRSKRSTMATAESAWRRETFCLPRDEARAKAREWFERFPKAAYMTEIESWRELTGDRIEFVIRRLPSAD
jgi:hypothetical protein